MSEQRYFRLRLLDDIIITAKNKSTETSASLDYIPGRMILGAVASRLYSSLSKEDQFLVFHSGKVRFMDARPCAQLKNGQFEQAFPISLSFHHVKGTKKSDNGYLTEKVINRVQPNDEKKIKQLREGFFLDSGKYIQPKHNSSMRVSLEDGRSREGYLFGFDSLSQGTSLLFSIKTTDISFELTQRIVKALGSQIRIGRSKTAEYGRVAVEELDSGMVAKINDKLDPREGEVSLFLLSDLSIRNEWGMPSLDLNDLVRALGAKSWVEEKTFVRSRSYSPFHGFRCRPDLERQVWVGGSVITITLNEGQTLQDISSQIENGLGDYCQEGLGELLLNPQCLQERRPFRGNNLPVSLKVSEPPPPQLAWLVAHKKENFYGIDVLKKVKAWEQDFSHVFGDLFYKKISSSQWGQIRGYARVYRNENELRRVLVGAVEEKEDEGFVFSGKRKLESAWGYCKGFGQPSIGQFFHQKLYEKPSEEDEHLGLSDIVYAFAKHMQSELQKRKKNKKENA